MLVSRALAPAATLLLTLCAHAAAQDVFTAGLSPLGDKPARTRLTEDNLPGVLEVKFVHGLDVRLRDGRLNSANEEVQAIDAYLEAIGATRHRVFEQSEEWLDEWRQLAEVRSGKPLHDLNLFYRIELRAAGNVGEVCDALNAREAVQLAYPLGRVDDPTCSPVTLAGRADTPDFQSLQGYREAAPTGIDADYGNTFSGGIGTGITIADVETGWTDDHEDLAHKAAGQYIGLAMAYYPWDHGTAVLGELIGENQAQGVKGSVYDASVKLSTHQGDAANIPTAIAYAAAAAGVGDAIVIEAQCYGTPPGPFPCEYVASTYATVETATAAGTHVFAAAGNGDNNLDGSSYGGLFDRGVRDSGAVMCGASDGASLVKAGFSNYGSRLDAHGWGYDVTSAGYGDLYAAGSPSYLREYTDAFSGTSSATPIVTGAGLILDGIYHEAFGSYPDPLYLRNLLTTTGTPQTGGGYIGPRPDCRAAIEAMGVPRIELSGSTGPGDTFAIHSKGIPNSITILLQGSDLRANPLPIAPYGFLWLKNPIVRIDIGPLDGNGDRTYQETIPAGAPSGSLHAYYQGWHRYPSGPGIGALTNYVEVIVE